MPVAIHRPDGSIAGDDVRLVDFATAPAIDWLVVNQFSVSDGQHNRRANLMVFLNGSATIWNAYAQLQTYKAEIPSLLQTNAALVVSDGLQARIGSITANQEWFKVWRSIDGEVHAPATALELETLIRGVFEPQRFLDLLQHFIVFEEDPDSGALHKIIAGYHQFHRQGVLAKLDNQVELLQVYEFKSPSQAARLLLARSANGRLDWKDAAGITLMEHLERAAAAASADAEP
ncbi:DUF4357 domain-containing protein [Synechococcus sp. Cruz-9H2]|uniref:DUF4357 domain-containing protein n=1 Tax=unclassified Synechococcus TaxID=2626047 RepID=UPI0020CDEADF|nr:MULTISPECIES: DUF4357 domain-containing protein [unclassified Synechococcus]MCP9820866.1 DUF4357 domain-containing protein [Synechococcus sp. Cruz-9H2]MCP9845101.1 DUF4357 domain-containing protein [Synechococcus sp. Edmonson 11F2]MCP9857271.1 DUF4357 domain-containing protein [Synechococcus sp. Cruz-9C9]MCP9864517.1 DUF4357 domain-containing protein [Synechococcus sp. Cruz-7E5]MCP9871786.1 DUF4357 domain-containing protein [Synechococcus sp. Cruz-7B9]